MKNLSKNKVSDSTSVKEIVLIIDDISRHFSIKEKYILINKQSNNSRSNSNNNTTTNNKNNNNNSHTI